MPVRPPAQAKHERPVWVADAPWASTMPTWRCSRRRSASTSVASAPVAVAPPARSARPSGPNPTLAYDWVAIAPTPARAHGTTDPTARNLDLSLIHISEPTRLGMISYAVFCL